MIDVNGLPRIEWYRIPRDEFKKMLKGSDFEDVATPVEDNGDLVVTERNDVYLLSTFSEHEFDQSKALYNREGLYKYVDTMVRGCECDG